MRRANQNAGTAEGRERTPEPPGRRVLMITLAVPYPHGGSHRQRPWSLIRALRDEGWEITLITQARGVAREFPESLPLLCREVDLVATPGARASANSARAGASGLRFDAVGEEWEVSPQITIAARRHLEHGGFAAVLCDQFHARAALPPQPPAPVIVDVQRLEHEWLRDYANRAPTGVERLYARLRARKLRRWEAREAVGVYALAAGSAPEATQLRRLHPAIRVALLPEVVDTAEYEDKAGEEQAELVLCSGASDEPSDCDALSQFVSAAWPEIRRRRPSARLRVAGALPQPDLLRQIEITPGAEAAGKIEDLQADLARAAVCVLLPGRPSSGERMKLLEAAAMAKPILSTPAGAEGLDFQPGVEILITDEPNRLAACAVELMANPERRRALGQRARQRVERDYSLPALRRALAELLEPLAQAKTMAAGGAEP
ncbi:MAG TPA: glycosyltransferase [Candidatus Acidoferrales bacterium]|nr:glycosyltransferase [Candidatus Acidoferrales bacterium]